MAPLILLAFLAMPFVEIAVFVRVGSAIGAWPTVGLTLLSSAAGISLMRYQGLATLARARLAIERNEPPVDDMLDGLCILLAGVLLIVPGFVTDAFGLLLFIPWIRRHVRRQIWRGLERGPQFRSGARQGSQQGTVIETDYVVVRETHDPDGKSPPQNSEPPRPELPHIKREGEP